MSQERKFEEMVKASDASSASAAQVITRSKADHKLQEGIHLEDYPVNEDKVHQLQPETSPADQPLP